LYANIQSIDASLAYALPSPPPTLPDDSDYDFDFVNTLNIFGESKQVDIQSRFRRDADAFYVEAKRSMVASVAQIPTWIYGALLVLGWNEAMAVLFNPFYFAVLLCALATAWAIFKLNLVGPLTQVTRTLGNEVQRQASNRLREHFSQPQLAQPVSTRPIERAFERMSVNDDDYDGASEAVELQTRRPEPL